MERIEYLYVNEIVRSVSETHSFDAPALFAVNTSDVENGKMLEPPLLPIDELKGQFKKKIQNGDILFSEIRPANRHFAVVSVNDPQKYVASTKLMVLRKFNEKVDSEYFYYWLTNTHFLNVLQRRAENRICSFPQITFELLSEYRVPVPSIDTQRQIAKILSLIDGKIENNNSISFDLEAMAKLLYDYWFVQYDFPDENGKPYKSSGGKMVWNEELKREIPEGWEAGTFGDCIASINTGLNPRDNFKLNTGGTIRYLTVKNLTKEGTVDFSSCDCIDEEARAIVHRRSDIRIGDILFASIAPLGRCYVIKEDPKTWDINESVFSIRPNYKIATSNFLYMTFMSDSFVKKAEGSSTGSVFKGIRISELQDLKTIIPKKAVLDKFDDVVEKLFAAKSNAFNENMDLASLRDFLLPMLMNGQVKVCNME